MLKVKLQEQEHSKIIIPNCANEVGGNIQTNQKKKLSVDRYRAKESIGRQQIRHTVKWGHSRSTREVLVEEGDIALEDIKKE